jgi:hypothetical protein
MVLPVRVFTKICICKYEVDKSYSKVNRYLQKRSNT